MKNFLFLFESPEQFTGLVIRLTLALVLLPHGCQLLFGWFGGFGFSATMKFFTEAERIPWLIGFMVIMLQSVGAMLILFGFGSRILAFGTIIMFIGMIFTSHLKFGFFMNWFGTQKGEGYEYHLLVIGLCVALLFSGSGRFSVDRLLVQYMKA
jgi:putative oxidoreductase